MSQQQSVFSNNDQSGFKQSSTASMASSSSSSSALAFQNADTTAFKAAGGGGVMMSSHGPSFGPVAGMGPGVSDPMMFGSSSSPMQMGGMMGGMGMPMGGKTYQQQAPGPIGAKVQLQAVPVEPTEPAPLIRDNDINWMRSMGTAANPQQASLAFIQACADQGILDVEANGFKLSGRYFSESHKMAEFYVGIYQTGAGRTIVEVNSSQGPIFQEFLTATLNSMRDLPEFDTQVNIDHAYNWSPLPLPIFSDDETPSSPDLAAESEPGFLPGPLPLGGFPPEISASLGFSFGDDTDPDTQKRMFLEDIVDSLETGYAREIADAAPNLAIESEDADNLVVMRQIENIVNRLLTIIDTRLDACLVRSCVIALGNLLSDAEFAQSVRELNVQAKLTAVAQKWSDRQAAHLVEGEYIQKSREIERQVQHALGRMM